MAYIPVSGIGGVVVFTDVNGGNHTLCADSYQYHIWANIHEAPSFCNVNDLTKNSSFMTHAPGVKRGGCTLSGTWNAADNLFSDGIKINQAGCFLNLQQTNFSLGAVTGPIPVIVADWQITDDADGLTRWTATFIFDGIFPDFSGSNA